MADPCRDGASGNEVAGEGAGDPSAGLEAPELLLATRARLLTLPAALALNSTGATEAVYNMAKRRSR